MQETRTSHTKIVRTEPNIIQRLYDLLESTHSLLKELDIKYWITCGSLLGAVRHQSIIPWDDDIDLAMMESEIPRLWENRDKFKPLGLQLVKYKFGFKVFHLDSPPIPNQNHHYPFLDIFVMTRDIINGKDAVAYKNLEYRKEYPEHFFVDELYPFTEYRLGKYILPGPGKNKPFLDRVYGNDWKEVGRTHNLDHITKESLHTYTEYLS